MLGDSSFLVMSVRIHNTVSVLTQSDREDESAILRTLTIRVGIIESLTSSVKLVDNPRASCLWLHEAIFYIQVLFALTKNGYVLRSFRLKSISFLCVLPNYWNEAMERTGRKIGSFTWGSQSKRGQHIGGVNGRGGTRLSFKS